MRCLWDLRDSLAVSPTKIGFQTSLTLQRLQRHGKRIMCAPKLPDLGSLKW